MAEDTPKYNPRFEDQAQGFAVGDNNIIYNYFGYREEIVTAAPVDAADDNLSCPYRGLYHFNPNDAEYFFGRDVFIETLFEATQTRNFIPILGASGSGKSSVVLAGLIPKLEQEQKGHWKFTHFRPSSDPFHALALALVPLYTPDLDETEQIAQTRKLAGYLNDNTIPLSDVFARIHQNHFNHRILLIADQFEEIYTQCSDHTVRNRFLDCLLANFQPSNSGASSSTVLVTTMRADFLANALSYRPLADMLQNADIKIGAMSREELTEVIEKPAKKLGVTFEAGLVERILNDVEDEPGNLPLLEFALTELWKKRTGKQLIHKAYEAIGQVKGALADYADDKYEKLRAEEQEQARRIFIQLVRPGEGTEDTRRRANRAELGEENWNLITHKDGLADSRLVVTSRNDSEQETVEVVHEALIQNWGKLRQWMETHRRFRTWQERLRVAMRQWEEAQQDEGALLRGLPLVEAEDWQQKRLPELGKDEQDFIKTSLDLRDREKKERDRQHRRTIITLTSFSVVVSVLALVAGMGWWRTVIAEKNAQLIARSQSSEALFASNKKFDALLESIRAGKQMKKELGKINANTEMQVISTLMQSVYGVKERNRFEGYNQPFIRASFSSDGKRIAATNMEDTIKIWDLNGEEIKTINSKKSGNIKDPSSSTGDCPVNSVSFNPSSNTIAASDGDNIKLWDFHGRELKIFPGKGKDVTVTSISNDGKLIAAVSSHGKVNIWNRNGEDIPAFQHSENFFPLMNPISFSPDGKSIASSDGEKNVILWNLQTKKAKTLKNQWNVCSIDFNSNSRELAVTEYLSGVRFWSIEDQNENDFFEDFRVISVIHSPEGIVSTNWDGTIKFWHLFNNEWRVNSSWKGHSAPVWNASFSPDKKMLVSVSNDKTIKLWNLEGIKPPSFSPSNHSATLGDISLSPDGQTIATVTPTNVTGDGSIKLWNLNGNLRPEHFQKVSLFSEITFSPDGKYLVSSFRNLVQLWNINSGESKTLIKQKLSIRDKRNDFGRASFSSDGKTIAVGREDGTVKLLHLDGTEITTLKGGSKLVSYSPNGKIIASASSNNTVKLWSTDGKELPPLVGSPYPITSLSFSPDSKTLVAGNQNGNILIWSLTGKLLHTLQGHNSAVSGLTFRPDSKIFASASGNGSNEDDGTIKFWSVDGREIKTFKTESSSVSSINFSPDGKMLVWANGVEVIMWNLDLDYLLSKGCDWVRDYLENNVNVSKEDKELCDL